jgi:hypothetical protein
MTEQKCLISHALSLQQKETVKSNISCENLEGSFPLVNG